MKYKATILTHAPFIYAQKRHPSKAAQERAARRYRLLKTEVIRISELNPDKPPFITYTTATRLLFSSN